LGGTSIRTVALVEMVSVALHVLVAAIVVPTLVRHAHDSSPAYVSFTRRRL
jgi:hypothetical protein